MFSIGQFADVSAGILAVGKPGENVGSRVMKASESAQNLFDRSKPLFSPVVAPPPNKVAKIFSEDAMHPSIETPQSGSSEDYSCEDDDLLPPEVLEEILAIQKLVEDMERAFRKAGWRSQSLVDHPKPLLFNPLVAPPPNKDAKIFARSAAHPSIEVPRPGLLAGCAYLDSLSAMELWVLFDDAFKNGEKLKSQRIQASMCGNKKELDCIQAIEIKNCEVLVVVSKALEEMGIDYVTITSLMGCDDEIQLREVRIDAIRKISALKARMHEEKKIENLVAKSTKDKSDIVD